MNKKTDVKQPDNQPSDAELLMLISWKDQKAESEAAFEEFYKRYGPYLKLTIESVCHKHNKRYGKNLSKEVLSNTIIAIADNADSILTFIDESEDIHTNNLAIKASLYNIADHELRASIIAAEKKFRENHPRMLDSVEISRNALLKKAMEEQDDVEEIENENVQDELPPIEEMKVINTVLSTLDERDSEIFNTYLEFEVRNKKMPRQQIKLLCDRWGTTPDNLRQIKSRVIKKIRDFVKRYQQKSLISVD